MSIDWSKQITAEMQSAERERHARDARKAQRQAAVDAIVVAVDGLRFDGDELSQQRMMRRADAMGPDDTARWVLADNTVRDVTRTQLSEAVRLAMLEQERLWPLEI
ncbi:DUF4376 domain-containing protein [Aeromonas simiae]|uniref:DUF4376 domain-containing protein n=1 Tax=Aeromonas simiae TaxID=218936 RepID=UPI00069352DF|nr:hypothetical protein [Aeromonas simiae]